MSFRQHEPIVAAVVRILDVVAQVVGEEHRQQLRTRHRGGRMARPGGGGRADAVDGDLRGQVVPALRVVSHRLPVVRYRSAYRRTGSGPGSRYRRRGPPRYARAACPTAPFLRSRPRWPPETPGCVRYCSRSRATPHRASRRCPEGSSSSWGSAAWAACARTTTTGTTGRRAPTWM